MEIPRLDPGITICKIAVLPVKLYPLNIYADKGLAPLYLDHESIMLLFTSTCIDLSEKGIEPLQLASAKLKLALSTNSSTRTIKIISKK
jgi:hypothetical protein